MLYAIISKLEMYCVLLILSGVFFSMDMLNQVCAWWKSTVMYIGLSMCMCFCIMPDCLLVSRLYTFSVYFTLGSGPVITTDNTEILITDIGEDASASHVRHTKSGKPHSVVRNLCPYTSNDGSNSL